MKMSEVQIKLNTRDLVQALEQHTDKIDDDMVKKFREHVENHVDYWLDKLAMAFCGVR